MRSPSNYSNITYQYNFLTEDIVSADPVTGLYTFQYNYLEDPSDLTWANGYDTDYVDSGGATDVDERSLPNRVSCKSLVRSHESEI